MNRRFKGVEVFPDFTGDFEKFPKIPRYIRETIITEKIDGTNAQIFIEQIDMDADVGTEGEDRESYKLADGPEWRVLAGSRNRWLGFASPKMQDNHGFAAWVFDHRNELIKGLGPGRHYGEWWGKGIQRGYELDEKRFSLFNVTRWDKETFQRYKVEPWNKLTRWGSDQMHKHPPCPIFSPPPDCCHVVPVLGIEHGLKLDCWKYATDLKFKGSVAAPGFNKPEGIVIFHTAGNVLFKHTIEDDDGKA